MALAFGVPAPGEPLGRSGMLGVLALDAGAAWFEAAANRGRVGTVRALFGRACYLQFGDRLLALGRADVASGPLHLRIAALPDLQAGDPVTLSPGRLVAGSLAIGFGPDRRWQPEAVAARELRRIGGRRRTEAWTGPSRTGLTAAMVAGARELVAADDLVGLAGLLGGRGPGLTPAGDDVLAGVLVIDAMLRPERDGTRQAAVDAVETTDVARAFLHWAALGQCIEPFHQVVSAMVSGQTDCERLARARLRKTGASSGHALLLGLDLALAQRCPP